MTSMRKDWHAWKSDIFYYSTRTALLGAVLIPDTGAITLFPANRRAHRTRLQ